MHSIKNIYIKKILICWILLTAATLASNRDIEEERSPISSPSGSMRFDRNERPDKFILQEIKEHFLVEDISWALIHDLRSQINFIAHNPELMNIHSLVAEKLTQRFISYRKSERVHWFRSIAPTTSSAFLMLTSGLYSFYNNTIHPAGTAVGIAQMASVLVPLATAVTTYPPVYDHLIPFCRNWKDYIWTLGQDNDSYTPLPYHYNVEVIKRQSNIIALYLMAVNKTLTKIQWDQGLDKYVTKMTKLAVNSYTDPLKGLSFYLHAIDDNDQIAKLRK